GVEDAERPSSRRGSEYSRQLRYRRQGLIGTYHAQDQLESARSPPGRGDVDGPAGTRLLLVDHPGVGCVLVGSGCLLVGESVQGVEQYMAKSLGHALPSQCW